MGGVIVDSQENSTSTINVKNENMINKTKENENENITEKENNKKNNSNKIENEIKNNNQKEDNNDTVGEKSNNSTVSVDSNLQENKNKNSSNSIENDNTSSSSTKSQSQINNSTSTITSNEQENNIQSTSSTQQSSINNSNSKNQNEINTTTITSNESNNQNQIENQINKENDTKESNSSEIIENLITQVDEDSLSSEKRRNSIRKKTSMKKLKKLENSNTIFPTTEKDDEKKIEGLTKTSISKKDKIKHKNKKITSGTITTTSTVNASKISTKNNSFFKSFFLSCFSCWACKNSDIDNIKITPKDNTTDLSSLTSPIPMTSANIKRFSLKAANNELLSKNNKQDNEKSKWLLKPQLPEDIGKKTLVLDLDETLVHSSFKPITQPDYIIPVQIENQVHHVYVLKRPGVDEFLKKMGEIYEIVIFTASVGKYADPVLDTLDKYKVVRHRLFREACIHYKGNYVKDLSQLGRNLKHVIILDNSPASYIFHPANAIPVTSWFNDKEDNELYELIPFLLDLKKVDNVTLVLDNNTDI